jgi:hypothetical protein
MAALTISLSLGFLLTQLHLIEAVQGLAPMRLDKVLGLHLWRRLLPFKYEYSFTLCRGHYNYRQGINPFIQNVSIVDCGDFPISPFDNGLAFAQMEEWYKILLSKEVKNPKFGQRSQYV